MWSRFTGRGRRAVVATIVGLGFACVVAPATAAIAADAPDGIRAADSAAAGQPSTLQPAMRLGTPRSAAVEGPVRVDNVSTCRTYLARPALTLTIPSLAYSCPVYTDGQAAMDAGAVVLVVDQSPALLLARHPGEPGTLWIAAHRTTHGGAFASVPDIADGALITVADSTASATYRVVARALVTVRDDLVVDASGRPTSAATLEAITRADRRGDPAPRLLLQTCEGSTMRWMIYADLVTG
jgi:sortase (surface protein transpeptidase)